MLNRATVSPFIPLKKHSYFPQEVNNLFSEFRDPKCPYINRIVFLPDVNSLQITLTKQ